MVATVFIDGEAGTTGLLIRERLAGRIDMRLVSIDPDRRKDPAARRDCLNSVEVVILCLPDEAARQAVGLIENPEVRVIDASTAHRTAPQWVFGFPELAPGQRAAIGAAMRVSNPGCYATGFIALARPLVDAGLLPADALVTANAVSGYTGGGRAMIAEFEDPSSPDFTQVPFRTYSLGLNHKHVCEMQRHAGLDHPPLFAPAVGRFRQGMIVEIPLHLAALAGRPKLDDLREVLAEAYAEAPFVHVASKTESEAVATLNIEQCNGTNLMRLHVFGSPDLGQARLAAVFDNLGKGASGAAVQNLNLMLGFDEVAGL